MPSLSDMPEVVMQKILEKINLQSLINLRKVSHGFRDYIDLKSPEIKLKNVNITLDAGKLHFNMESLSDVFRIQYCKEGKECIIKLNENEKKMTFDYLKSFFTDFQAILKHQKSIMTEFNLYINKAADSETIERFMKNLQKTLEKTHLKVKYLEISVTEYCHFMSVLPFFDVKSLEEIQLYNTKYDRRTADLQDIARLEQWKQAKEVFIRNWTISSNIRDFAHFSKINVKFEVVTAEGMHLLKESFAWNTDAFQTVRTSIKFSVRQSNRPDYN
uniref:F-box domain-containing protein n=1 Tax=Caenorhabditis tropicalis TaxID=1561998 RepID=A0A1I7UWK3_9PELO